MTARSQVPQITAQEADERLKASGDEPGGPLLVDVREVGEFLMARAAGAVLFPISTFIARLHELPKDRELMLICESGNRSAQATAYLLANGWASVVNVAGGTTAWQRAGLEVRRGAVAPGEGLLPQG